MDFAIRGKLAGQSLVGAAQASKRVPFDPAGLYSIPVPHICDLPEGSVPEDVQAYSSNEPSGPIAPPEPTIQSAMQSDSTPKPSVTLQTTGAGGKGSLHIIGPALAVVGVGFIALALAIALHEALLGMDARVYAMQQKKLTNTIDHNRIFGHSNQGGLVAE